MFKLRKYGSGISEKRNEQFRKDISAAWHLRERLHSRGVLGGIVCLQCGKSCCFWGVLCSWMLFGTLAQANLALSLLFSWDSWVQAWAEVWFSWSLPSTAEAGGCPGEGEWAVRIFLGPAPGSRDNSMGSSGGFGNVGPRWIWVQAGTLLGKDVGQEGLCEDPQALLGGQVGQLTCPVETELAHQYGYQPWL